MTASQLASGAAVGSAGCMPSKKKKHIKNEGDVENFLDCRNNNNKDNNADK